MTIVTESIVEEAALAGLRKDIEKLRRVAAKYEFTPLAPALRAGLVQAVREFESEFARVGMSVSITYETWTNPATKWTKAAHQAAGSVRIHFGGEAVFAANGMVEVQ